MEIGNLRSKSFKTKIIIETALNPSFFANWMLVVINDVYFLASLSWWSKFFMIDKYWLFKVAMRPILDPLSISLVQGHSQRVVLRCPPPNWSLCNKFLHFLNQEINLYYFINFKNVEDYDYSQNQSKCLKKYKNLIQLLFFNDFLQKQKKSSTPIPSKILATPHL